MRLLALAVPLLLLSSTASAQVIGYGEEGDYVERPREMWQGWGLLDRMQIAPARLSLTTELGSLDGADTATSTLHAQISTSCDCRYGAYFTLPLAYALGESPVFAAAGMVPPRPSRIGWRTADVGVFISPRESHHDTLWRIGALLPTASEGPHTPSARAGDMVLELSRSAGARLSASHMLGYLDLPRGWFGRRAFGALRWDSGIDLAYELDVPAAGRPMHVIPHAGLGALVAFRTASISLDTVIAMDPTDSGAMNVRWSTGVTGRLGSPDPERTAWYLPALTLALVRTPEGWGGTIALDLAVTRARARSH